MANPPSITGKKFGRLTVLMFWSGRHRATFKFMCQCDCGTRKPILLQNLIYGRNPSCGCVTRERNIEQNKERAKERANKLIGKRFGMLTIEGFAFTRFNTCYVACKCDCGERNNFHLTSIEKGNTKSCGCYRLQHKLKKDRDNAILNGKFIGVSQIGSNYYAKINIKRKKKSLGGFTTAVEAAKAYDKAAYEALREKAALNFPEDYEQLE
jgi:hypothetical protein